MSPTNCHGLRAIGLATESGCEQIIHRPTHRSGNTLDLIFTDAPAIVASNVGSPIGTSDHCFVSAHIKIEQTIPDVSSSRKIYLKSQADWNGVLSDLSNINWSHFYRQLDCIAAFSTACEGIIERRIPSRIVTFRNKDKAWFNAECRRAYLDKQEAYHLWQRNRSQLTWNQFTRLRAVAQEVYASAEREYNNNVRETLLCTSHSI